MEQRKYRMVVQSFVYIKKERLIVTISLSLFNAVFRIFNQNKIKINLKLKVALSASKRNSILYTILKILT
jgi:hypothetical protein